MHITPHSYPPRGLLHRSEGCSRTGYFFPAHGGWGNDNSEKLFSARRRRRPLEGVPGQYAQTSKKTTQTDRVS